MVRRLDQIFDVFFVERRVTSNGRVKGRMRQRLVQTISVDIGTLHVVFSLNNGDRYMPYLIQIRLFEEKILGQETLVGEIMILNG